MDIFLGTLFLLFILMIAFLGVGRLGSYLPLSGEFGGIIKVILFYLNMVLCTLITLWAIRKIFPLKEGVFPLEDKNMTFWKLQAFFYIFNLGLFINAGILPINLRRLFYLLLGAELGKRVMVGGKILEPLLVKIGDFTQIGEDALITSHTVEKGRVTLGKIRIGKNVTVGVKAVILPGVVIEDGSIIAAGSVVAKGTRIPANEVWGGIPARKIKRTG